MLLFAAVQEEESFYHTLQFQFSLISPPLLCTWLGCAGSRAPQETVHPLWSCHLTDKGKRRVPPKSQMSLLSSTESESEIDVVGDHRLETQPICKQGRIPVVLAGQTRHPSPVYSTASEVLKYLLLASEVCELLAVCYEVADRHQFHAPWQIP